MPSLIVLPAREVMRTLLTEVLWTRLLEQDFYPPLLQEAGKVHTPESLAALLEQAVKNCSERSWMHRRHAKLATIYLSEYADALARNPVDAQKVKEVLLAARREELKKLA